MFALIFRNISKLDLPVLMTVGARQLIINTTEPKLFLGHYVYDWDCLQVVTTHLNTVDHLLDFHWMILDDSDNDTVLNHPTYSVMTAMSVIMNTIDCCHAFGDSYTNNDIYIYT